MSITIRDVAQAAGVSTATVSRALRGLPHVDPETRERVRRVAAELDYVVSPSASRLASASSGGISRARSAYSRRASMRSRAETGIAAPRDTDQQEAGVGEPVDWNGDPDALERGDLVFWKGHVGIVAGPDQLLHANGFHMATVIEPLGGAIARIASGGVPVTSVRRLAGYRAKS